MFPNPMFGELEQSFGVLALHPEGVTGISVAVIKYSCDVLITQRRGADVRTFADEYGLRLSQVEVDIEVILDKMVL